MILLTGQKEKPSDLTIRQLMLSKLKWRRRQDSNLWYPFGVQRFSKPPLSATQPRLRIPPKSQVLILAAVQTLSRFAASYCPTGLVVGLDTFDYCSENTRVARNISCFVPISLTPVSNEFFPDAFFGRERFAINGFQSFKKNR